MNGIKDVDEPVIRPGKACAGRTGAWLREEEAGLSGWIERAVGYCDR